MSTTAFPVRQDTEGVGCTDIALRQMVKALHPTKGIITGLKVTGQNALSYKVASGVAICSKGSSDGNTIAYFEGGSVETTANTASNPRIDVVWITSHDVTQGDTDNLVTIGCTQGTAAASPTAPSIPSYATKLYAMKLPANASTTSSATQYGSANVITDVSTMGRLATNTLTNSTEGDKTKLKWYTENSVTFTVPTKRLIELVYEVAVCEHNGSNKIGWGVKCFNVDGKEQANTTYEFRVEPDITETRVARVLVEVSAGSHTASVTTGKMSGDDSGTPYFIYGSASNGRSYIGRRLTVWDRGSVD